jgi:hypothetical protein
MNESKMDLHLSDHTYTVRCLLALFDVSIHFHGVQSSWMFDLTSSLLRLPCKVQIHFQWQQSLISLQKDVTFVDGRIGDSVLAYTKECRPTERTAIS